MSDMLEVDDNSADEDGQNDIDISRMNTSSSNNDYTMGGSEELQALLTDLITEYKDIFSYSIKGRSMEAPPMEFKVDERSSGNRMASRQMSIEKKTLSRHISTSYSIKR